MRLVAAASVALIVTAAAAADTELRTYTVPGRGKVEMVVPADWYDEPRPGTGGIPVVRFFDRLGAAPAFDMVVTIVWSAPGADFPGEPRRLRTLVSQAAEAVAPGAAERQLTILEIPIENGAGYFFRATAKAPTAEKLTHLAQGALASKDLMLTFTILTAERNSPFVEQALAMLKTARRMQ
jgi:hypothetical protein